MNLTQSHVPPQNLEISLFPFFLTPKFFLDEIFEQPANQFYSEFTDLKRVRSDYLVELIELVRSKHGRMFILTANLPPTSLKSQINNYSLTNSSNIKPLLKLLYQLAQAISELQRFNLVHGLLNMDQIYINENDEKLLLTGYWWNKLSEFGLKTEFPICNLENPSPELITYYLNKKLVGLSSESLIDFNLPYNHKTDIWSLGSILFELITTKNIYNTKELDKKFIKLGLKLFLGDGKTTIWFNQWIKDCLEEAKHSFEGDKEELDQLIEIVKACLIIDPSERLSLDALRCHPLVVENTPQSTNKNWQSYPILPSLKTSNMDTQLDIQQLIHIWKLGGGDINQLIEHKLPPILTLPSLIQSSEDLQGDNNKDPTLLFDQNSFINLNLSELINEKLKQINYQVELIPSVVNEGDNIKEKLELPIFNQFNNGNLSTILNQKEFSLNYNRLLLFNTLLNQYPISKEEIKLQAREGIPSQLRGKIWASLLDVNYSDLFKYDAVDKGTPMEIDKQLQMDIIRCQQYNPLLASPLGHKKLLNLLKSWQLLNPQLVYWQGIDSLAGIFLSCNFNNEALALVCLENFINKFQFGFFIENNSLTLWGYLGIFLQLINFHDPLLTNHLHKLGLGPKAYAINWFYTMFAYVFPLDSLVLLWDRILINSPTYPWMIGLAILSQLRDQILQSEQLGTIPLSTDAFLDIDLELCLTTADALYETTPSTLFDIELFNLLNPPTGNSWEFPEEIVNLPVLSFKEWETVQAKGFIIDLRAKSQFQDRHLKNSFHLDRPAHLLKVVANTLRPYSDSMVMGLICDDKQMTEGFVSGLVRNQFAHLIRITEWESYYSELIDISGDADNQLDIEWCNCKGIAAFQTQPKYKDNTNVLLSRCIQLRDLQTL